ncbi:MAG TPA: ABC transporter ATP-binding protein [Stellaceae bacterium]|nr:ABC transporter ATP-binding protein [Stellaceae bacterium]
MTAAEETGEAVPPILAVVGLSKRFDGLVAVDAVSLAVRLGEIHAVIGPNGAGKTTLINLLSGDLAPSTGSVLLDGRDIAGLPAHRIARLGVSRSYQRTNIFRDFTVFENCRLAAQSRLKSSMRFFRPADAYRAVNDAAEQVLALVGLARQADRLAGMLSHGEQRQLEIAMTLATRPKVLLLDEPLAGMGAEESVEVTALIARLAATHAILLVEHDMDAVFSIAHRLTVMVNGRVLESGAPQAIRQSKAVQDAYLGAEDLAVR